MQGDTNLLVDAIRRASRSLQRDFFELENLQSSEKSSFSFAQKACDRAMRNLYDGIKPYYDTIIFTNEDANLDNFSDRAAFVEVLDGLGNFERSLAYFGIMVTILVKKNEEIITEKSIMNFPALGEIYYTEKGRGAWCDRLASNVTGAFRTRVSGRRTTDDMMIASSNNLINIAKTISSNVRVFDCYTYSLAQLIRGKIDALIIEPRNISLAGIELFIKESGGVSYIHDNNLLVSNFELHKKIKHLIEKLV
jgi:fructose-1,6-bisphosphatase/inositol monophosphatase family enzyme